MKSLETLVSLVSCSSSQLRVSATDDWINSQLWVLLIIHLPAVPQRADDNASTHIW